MYIYTRINIHMDVNTCIYVYIHIYTPAEQSC